MALNLWSVSAIRWRHLLRFETVLRSCDCGLTCGVPDFLHQSARAREGRVKSEAGFVLDRAPSSSFARAIRGGFGDCSEGRGRCGAMGLHVVKVVPLLRKGLIASRAHARDVRKTPLPDFCANLSESVLGGMVRVA